MVLQSKIEKDDVRLRCPSLGKSLFGIRRCGQDLESRLGPNHLRNAVPQEAVVVKQDQGNGLF